jgi:dipeptidyl aminopeptidase/acylaminoacyl peptidase
VRRGAAFAVACAAATLGLGCGSEDSERLAGAGPSRVAFSFGGRIHVMNPDGSGRVRLTGGRFGREDDGDSMPAWSPDVSRLAFVRSVYHRRSGDGDLRIYLIDAAGGPARRLPVPGGVLAPAWSPDGQRLAFVRAREEESQIVVASLDGGGEHVLYSERPGKGKLAYLNDPAWSPDGSQIAFTRTTVDDRSYFRPQIYVMPSDGGTPRVLAPDAAGPAWSPDGRRIAFASVRDRNGDTCYEDECVYMGELYLMDADGTNLTRLTHNRGDDRSPSWSADGRRVAFASDRNSPRFGGSEIYSIGSDGSCLTWLTNGSPASGDPDWSSGPATPSPCGMRRRRAIVQTDTRPLRQRHAERVYWLGERYGGRLLGYTRAGRDGPVRHSYYLVYDDCGRFQPTACVPELQLQEASVCSSGSSTLSLVVNEPTYQHRVRAYTAHGLLFVDIGQQDLTAVIGATQVRMFPGVGGARGQRLATKALLDLREIGRPSGRLPSPVLPVGLLDRLRRTERAHAHSGSLDEAARVLGIPRQQVRRRLELARAVHALPAVRALDCKSANSPMQCLCSGNRRRRTAPG